jgi:uncharacterized OB-fold protein
VAIRRADFPLPDLDEPLTAPFFAAAARRELRIPRCDRCAAFVWYPQPACPRCGDAPGWVPVSGRGALFSWAVVRRAFLPAFEEMVPFVSGLVAIDEDPSVRVVSYVVDAEPGSLYAGMPVVADFRPLAFPTVPGREVVVPVFRPLDAPAGAGGGPR